MAIELRPTDGAHQVKTRKTGWRAGYQAAPHRIIDSNQRRIVVDAAWCQRSRHLNAESVDTDTADHERLSKIRGIDRDRRRAALLLVALQARQGDARHG